MRFPRVAAWVLAAGFATCGWTSMAMESWQYEITSESWSILNGPLWKNCGGYNCSGGEYFHCAGFPPSSSTGVFDFYCHDGDEKVPDHIQVQLRVTASGLDTTWRSWLDPEGIGDLGAQAIDLLSALRPVAAWVQVYVGGGERLLLEEIMCGRWEFSGWSQNAHIFPNGVLILGLPTDTELTFSFDLFLEEDGCDSWNDGGIRSRGRITVRSWAD